MRVQRDLDPGDLTAEPTRLGHLSARTSERGAWRRGKQHAVQCLFQGLVWVGPPACQEPCISYWGPLSRVWMPLTQNTPFPPKAPWKRENIFWISVLMSSSGGRWLWRLVWATCTCSKFSSPSKGPLGRGLSSRSDTQIPGPGSSAQQTAGPWQTRWMYTLMVWPQNY